MKAAAAAPVVEQASSPSPPKSRNVSSTEDMIFASAIRTLAPILHPTELAKYSAILASPATVDERRAGWKSRRS